MQFLTSVYLGGKSFLTVFRCRSNSTMTIGAGPVHSAFDMASLRPELWPNLRTAVQPRAGHAVTLSILEHD